MKLAQFIREQNLSSEEVVFFGGSFHPWHEGHSECIRLLPLEKNLIVLPDHNPQKKMVTSQYKLSGIEEIQNELSKIKRKTYLYEGFWLLDKINPTVEWVKELKKEEPQVKVSLLMGFDSFEKIHTWNEATTLLDSLYALYVVSRLESPQQKEICSQSIREIAPKLRIHFLGNHPFEHLSSTALRE